VFILGTEDIAVVVEGTHYCVKSRGVEDHSSYTYTAKLGGCFRTEPEARAEFMTLIKR
jgi:GTP cyclohydrolase I